VFLIVALGACSSHREMDFGSGLDAPYIKTPHGAVRGMLEMAGTTKDDTVIDLGCGDGRILIAAARDFHAKGIGYDLDPARVEEARRNAADAGVAGMTKFEEKNVLDAEIYPATVITVYLLPPVLEKMRHRFLGELAPGTRIVSHSFPLRDWKPDLVRQVEGRTLYLYTVR
jgi:ribosomal protein L11 methylase PrmA